MFNIYSSVMSTCSPFGISTPKTLSLPRASTHRAATTLESFPPEIPTTALHPLPFCSKNSLIHFTISSFTAFANQFYAWVKTLHDVEDLDSVPRNICTLRDIYQEDYEANIKNLPDRFLDKRIKREVMQLDMHTGKKIAEYSSCYEVERKCGYKEVLPTQLFFSGQYILS